MDMSEDAGKRRAKQSLERAQTMSEFIEDARSQVSAFRDIASELARVEGMGGRSL